MEWHFNFLPSRVRMHDNCCSFTVLLLCDFILYQSQENQTWSDVHVVSTTKPVMVSVRDDCEWVSGIKLAVRGSLQGGMEEEV